MLGSLGIRQKLALLLAIPLVAVILVMVPYVLDRADDAQAAGATASTASAARDIGGLIQTLQQERLLALGYLAVPNLDRSALVAQTQTAVDDTERLRTAPATAAIIEKAAYELNELSVVRRSVVNRATLPLTVYTAFRNANTALLDALGLIRPPGVDAPGLTQLSALESLMRSNEEASSVGAMLVTAAADPTVSATLISEAQTAERQYLTRFRQLVPTGQAALVDSVENGQAGQRIRQLTLIVSNAPKYGTAEVAEALTAAVTYAGLRRLAQDRVARDIATTADNRASAARNLVTLVIGIAFVVLIVVIWLGVTVGRSIARPLQRLSRAAAAVAELSRAELVRVADSDTADPGPPQLAAVEVDSADEIGELATVVNRVQATAALLLERQVTTRSNVATMFANIARRTQNLVGRQLNLLDELARVETDPQTLERIERLDHVTTRLRRSADSLLVVSGTIDQVMSGTPSPLTDVISAALAEIEGFAAVDVGTVATVGVNASLMGDLRLLLAELLENATNFSPPGLAIEVSAVMGEECQILIVDHGVGMSPAKLQDENRRLVERERLDVAPTTVLGLFVVGRLARRHGLSVQLGHTSGGGVTASVRIPVRLLSTSTRMLAIPAQRRSRRRALALAAGPAPVALTADPEVDASLAAVSRLTRELAALGPGAPFGWFDREAKRGKSHRASEANPSENGGDSNSGESHAGGTRVQARLVTTPLPAATTLPMTPSRPRHDQPGTDQVRLDQVRTDQVRTDQVRTDQPRPDLPRPETPSPESSRRPAAPIVVDPRTGLAQRVPGTHMVDNILRAPTPAGGNAAQPAVGRSAPQGAAGRGVRDPEAERDALNDYLSGLNRGSGESGPTQAERPL